MWLDGLRATQLFGLFFVLRSPLLQTLRLVNVDGLRAELPAADVADDGGRSLEGLRLRRRLNTQQYSYCCTHSLNCKVADIYLSSYNYFFMLYFIH